MASGSGSSLTLINEIHDQLLICQICLKPYRNPKALSCQHTFCRDCLVKHHEAEQERSQRRYLSSYARSLSCPVCRKRTELPAGGISKLLDNFFVSNLCEVVKRRSVKPPSTRCEICKPSPGSTATTRSPKKDHGQRSADNKKRRALHKCINCAKMLCGSCADLHRRTKVTRDHNLFDADVDDKDVQCATHGDETIRFYCEPCHTCICVLCTFHGHKDHEVLTLNEGIERNRRSLDVLLDRGRERCRRLRDSVDLIEKCETGMKTAEECISETAMECVRKIRKQERKLIEGLQEAYDEDTHSFMRQKKILQETVENIEGMCQLADVVGRDRISELKNEISVKLQKLLAEAATRASTPPGNIKRTVSFIPGGFFLGHLDIAQPSSTSAASNATSFPDVDADSPDDINETSTALLYSTNCNYPEDNDPRSTSPSKIDTSDNGPRRGYFGVFQERWENTTNGTEESKASSGIREPVEDKMTNTIAVYGVDRSTMTTTSVNNYIDECTDTAGLICTTDGSTQFLNLQTKSTGTETVRSTVENKSVLTNCPFQADKNVTTNRICTTAASTNTPYVVMLDMSVMARALGDDKATATKATITSDQSTSIHPSWETTRGFDLVEYKDFGTGKPLPVTSDVGSNTAVLEHASRGTRETMPTTVDIGTNTNRLQDRDAGGCKALPKTIDVCSNTAVLEHRGTGSWKELPETTESNINTPLLAHRGTRCCLAMPITLDAETNTNSMMNKNVGNCRKRLFGTSEMGVNTTLVKDKSVGGCQSLLNTSETGTNTPLLENKNIGTCKILHGTSGTNAVSLERTDAKCKTSLPGTTATPTEHRGLEICKTLQATAQEVGISTMPTYEATENSDQTTVETIGNAFETKSTDISELETRETKSSVNIIEDAARLGDQLNETKCPISSDVGNIVRRMCFDKQTNTVHRHVMHRNISTDSQTTADKQTATSTDVTLVYTDSVMRRPAVKISRGTITRRLRTVDRDTSTDDVPPSSLKVDRASSPVRFSSVDKAVSANRGEISEPVDTFQTLGKHTKLLETFASDPKLDSICEGSNESSSSDDELSSSTNVYVSRPLPVNQRPAPVNVWKDRTNVTPTHREKLLPASFGSRLRGNVGGGKSSNSTFSVEGRKTAFSILWKVETGTNMSTTEQREKAIGTVMDARNLGNKMAECISKLKNVSQRLEMKPPIAAVQPIRESMEIQAEEAEMENDRQQKFTFELQLPTATTSGKKQDPKEKISSLISKSSSSSKSRHKSVGRGDSSHSDNSDPEQMIASTPTASHRPRTGRQPSTMLARKQRFDLKDMLRSSSAKTRNSRTPTKPN